MFAKISRFSNVYRIYIKWKGDADPGGLAFFGSAELALACGQFKIRDLSINAEFNYKCDHQITFGVNFWDDWEVGKSHWKLKEKNQIG